MRTSRLFVIGGLFVSLAWLTAGGCSANDAAPPAAPTGNNTSGSGGSGQGDPTKLTPDASGVDSGLTNDLNPLCGELNAVSCMPDNGAACSDYMPPKPGAGGAGGESGAAGAESVGMGGAGAGGEPSGEGGMNGGAPSHGGASGAGASNGGAGAGGEGGQGGPDPGGLAAYGCQVTRQNDQLLRQCVPAGTGKVNAPCFSAADCAPSYACVTENGAGRCLPYCCNQDSNCTSGTFCAERPLRKAAADTSDTEPPRVPVCVPADACSLEDQFPCPAGTDCRCKGDTACMVVRDDGTTTCMKPGAGQQGEACPCAWNHVCSSVTKQCIKICRTDPTKDDCGAQKCQAWLPQNFGVCVGPLK
jgi:hypothetical protein